MAMTNNLPKMIEVRQTYRDSQPFDFPSLLHERFTTTHIREQIKPGMKIALGVGSRGIANLQEIVKAYEEGSKKR